MFNMVWTLTWQLEPGGGCCTRVTTVAVAPLFLMTFFISSMSGGIRVQHQSRATVWPPLPVGQQYSIRQFLDSNFVKLTFLVTIYIFLFCLDCVLGYIFSKVTWCLTNYMIIGWTRNSIKCQNNWSVWPYLNNYVARSCRSCFLLWFIIIVPCSLLLMITVIFIQ